MTSLAPDALFAAAVAALDGNPRVTGGTGFGAAPGRRVDGRIFAMLYAGALVVKLPATRVSELVAAGAAQPFDGGKGKPMREWATIPASRGDEWAGRASEAFAFVGGAGPMIQTLAAAPSSTGKTRPPS